MRLLSARLAAEQRKQRALQGVPLGCRQLSGEGRVHQLNLRRKLNQARAAVGRELQPVATPVTLGAQTLHQSTAFEPRGILDNNVLNFLNTAVAAGLAVALCALG